MTNDGKDPMRVLLLGNSFASAIQIPALRWAGPVRLVGIAGASLEKARATARREGIEHATDRWEELLEHEADLVLVSTPVALHHPMVLGVLDATGEQTVVLCEKPMALDASQSGEMVRRAAHRPAFLDHQLRFHPHLRALRARIEDVGPLQHARLRLFLPGESLARRPWSWWFDAARGGGMLGAIGSHALDLLRHLFGAVTAIRADLDRFHLQRTDPEGRPHPVSADTFASLTVRFARAGRAEVWTGFGLPGESSFTLEITGQRGGLRWDAPSDLVLSCLDGEPRRLEAPRAPTSRDLGLAVDQGVFSRALPLFLRALHRAWQSARPDLSGLSASLPEAATFADGHAVQLLLDAARRSDAEGGGWVDTTPVLP